MYSVVWTSIIVRQQGRYHITLYILLGCIGILAACEIASLLSFMWGVTSSGRFLQRQFITGGFAHHRNNLQDKRIDSLRSPIFRKRYKYVFKLSIHMFYMIFTAQFYRSETKFETSFRGVLAVSLLFMFGMVALFVIVVQPLTDINKVGKDSSILPQKQWSRMMLPDIVVPDSSTWSVLIVSHSPIEDVL